MSIRDGSDEAGGVQIHPKKISVGGSTLTQWMAMWIRPREGWLQEYKDMQNCKNFVKETKLLKKKSHDSLIYLTFGEAMWVQTDPSPEW